MNGSKKERRKSDRYDTEVKIYFQVNYDLKTKIEFQRMGNDNQNGLPKKHTAISRNVSAEGLRFRSHRQLREGDKLYLEVYLPKRKEPVYMIGEVRWSKQLPISRDDIYEFDTGVKLISVMGESVSKTIHLDKEYRVCWSVVLDYVFGSFRKMMQEKK